ncbi:hypothetical protein tb265_38460 [Gemmatimonadetes bacterium T265]|nr:hypothetical protein tb265_38460 [Gemmatimonadetes bacterium T265]
MTRGRWLAVALGAAAVLLLARAFAVAFVEYRWFAAFGPGALDVWRARAVDLGLLRVVAALVAGLFLYLNLLGVASTIDAVAVSRRLGGIEIAETVPAGRLHGLFALASAAFGIAMALPIADWVPIDALLTGRTFGEIEPYTGRDLAFFVYWLPFENGVYAWALVAVAFVTGAVVALYALTPGLRWARGRIRATVRVRRHLALFGVATLLLLAWGHRLDAYALLVDGSGANGAFVGTDELALLPTRFGLAIVSALAAVVVLRAGWAGQARLAFWAVTVVVLTTLLGRGLAGPIATVVLAPARLAGANAAAAANRALYTRRAYAADQVRAAAPGDPPLASPRDVVANLAIWDAAVLARLGASATDGRAPRAVVGWQPAGDTLAAVLAAARATPDPSAPSVAGGRDAARTGWRAVLLDPRTPGPLGAPARAGGDPGGRVDVPGVIYPGAGDAAVVAGPANRVVGDSFGSWGVRLASALAARDMRLLRADNADRDDVRLVRRRDPRERVHALLPFFSVGRDATPVVAVDSLWWAVTVLAASADYPLAAHLALDGTDADDLTSLRLAGTALVNAATGSVRLIAAPEPDADVRGWYARFPRLGARVETLAPALAAALPVPYDAAFAQARVYAEFGPRGVQGSPGRRVQLGESYDSSSGSRPGSAYVTSGATGSAVAATTFPVISVADRVAGVVVATGGSVPRTTWVPAGDVGPRWPDVLDSSAALDGVAGAGAARASSPALFDGGVHAVPTASGLLFARSHYAVAADGRPALTGVTLLLGDRTLRGATLRELFDSTATGAPRQPPRVLTGDQRLSAARGLYDDARRALQRGDWAAFGRALDAIGRVLAPVPAGDGR